jgi:O-antigen ligase
MIVLITSLVVIGIIIIVAVLVAVIIRFRKRYKTHKRRNKRYLEKRFLGEELLSSEAHESMIGMCDHRMLLFFLILILTFVFLVEDFTFPSDNLTFGRCMTYCLCILM